MRATKKIKAGTAVAGYAHAACVDGPAAHVDEEVAVATRAGQAQAINELSQELVKKVSLAGGGRMNRDLEFALRQVRPGRDR